MKELKDKNMKNKSLIIALLLMGIGLSAKDSLAIKVFQTYCWGCHHQTAQAFAPSFRFIANHRTRAQILAQILDSESSFKRLGYKINSMPSFSDLNTSELNAIVAYIQSYKDKK